MAVKRTNNVSSEISKIDRRVKSLESSVGTVSSVAGVVVTGADDENPPLAGGLRSSSAPFQYKRVYEAWIYGPKVTGNTSRAELYFEDDPEIAPGDYVRVQGINGNSASEIDISSSNNGYKVFATDTPPWDNADVREPGVPGQLRRSWRDTPPGNIDYTVFYNPVVVPPADSPTNAGLQLISTRLMDSVTASNTTVTVNFNSNHRFEVGDVLYWDLPESLLDGYADKLFKVSNVVDSNTVQYQLETPLAAPVSLSSGDLTGKFVYAVAQHYVEEGTTWVDTSVEPNKIYIWKDYRWYDTADPIGQVTPEQDGIAPSPVTDLAATSELPANATSPVINLTWTPPTTRSNGDPISGFLDGYDIWYKRSTEAVWKKEFVKDGGQGIAAHQIKDAVLLQNFTYNIRVYAVDIMAQYSTAATVNVSTAKFSEVLNAPSKPVVSSKLGTITVEWDGLDSAGNLPVPGIIYIEFHESTSSGFTPSSATLVETLPVTNSGNYVVLTERTMNTENPSLAPTYYYKTRFVRQISPTELETSAASIQSDGQKVTGVTGPDIVANTVTTNKLEAGFVTASLVRGDVIRAGANATSARVELRSTGIAAFNGIPGDPATFTVSASDGSTTITGGTLSAPTITGGTLQTNSIANRGIKITNNNLIAYDNSGTATFSVDGSNGQVFISGGMTIGDVNDIKTNIYFPGTTQINGGSIRTGTINASSIVANSITATQISSAYVYAGEISADKITSGELVGRTIRTVPAGNTAKRIIINTQGEIVFFQSGSSSEAGRIEGTANGLSLTPASQLSFDPGGSQVAYVSSSGMGFNGIDKRWIGSLIATGGIQAGNGNVILSSNGNINGAVITATGAMNAESGLNVTGSITGTSNCTVDNRFRQFGWTWAVNPGTTAAVHRAAGGSFEGFFGPTTSDARFKENVEELQDSLSIINQLRPVKYNFISESESPIINYGLIAQEVRPLFEANSNIVNGEESETDYLSIEYIQLIAPLIKAVQELSQKNDELQARIAALEGTT